MGDYWKKGEILWMGKMSSRVIFYWFFYHAIYYILIFYLFFHLHSQVDALQNFDEYYLYLILGILIFAGMVSFLFKIFLKYYSTEYFMSPAYLSEKSYGLVPKMGHGFFYRSYVFIPSKKISFLDLRQNIFQKIFGLYDIAAVFEDKESSLIFKNIERDDKLIELFNKARNVFLLKEKAGNLDFVGYLGFWKIFFNPEFLFLHLLFFFAWLLIPLGYIFPSFFEFGVDWEAMFYLNLVFGFFYLLVTISAWLGSGSCRGVIEEGGVARIRDGKKTFLDYHKLKSFEVVEKILGGKNISFNTGLINIIAAEEALRELKIKNEGSFKRSLEVLEEKTEEYSNINYGFWINIEGRIDEIISYLIDNMNR